MHFIPSCFIPCALSFHLSFGFLSASFLAFSPSLSCTVSLDILLKHFPTCMPQTMKSMKQPQDK